MVTTSHHPAEHRTPAIRSLELSGCGRRGVPLPRYSKDGWYIFRRFPVPGLPPLSSVLHSLSRVPPISISHSFATMAPSPNSFPSTGRSYTYRFLSLKKGTCERVGQFNSYPSSEDRYQTVKWVMTASSALPVSAALADLDRTRCFWTTRSASPSRCCKRES